MHQDLFRLFAEHSRTLSPGSPLRDSATAFIEGLAGRLTEELARDTRVFGQRTHAMFRYVAASLGECQIVKEEDAGFFYSASAELALPDYRLVLTDGQQLLVEVKNCHQPLPGCFEITQDYADRLSRYCDLVEGAFRFAIYWSQLGVWTLNPLGSFAAEESRLRLELEDAMKTSDMSILGDRMIGVFPSIAIRCYSDPSRPRGEVDSGSFEATIGRVAIMLGEEEVTDELEKRLAVMFAMYGTWHGVDETQNVEDGQLIWWESRVSSPMTHGDGPFEFIGYLSQMVAQKYNSLTVNAGEVQKLAPPDSPDALSVLIPRDYSGQVLKIWRLRQQPTPPGTNTAESPDLSN